MTEEFKDILVDSFQWLGDQVGQNVKIIDRLTTVKGNYDRHFTRTSQYKFIIEHFGVRFSGAVGMISGKEVHFEFKTDIIKRIERKKDRLEISSDLDVNTSRLIIFEII